MLGFFQRRALLKAADRKDWSSWSSTMAVARYAVPEWTPDQQAAVLCPALLAVESGILSAGLVRPVAQDVMPRFLDIARTAMTPASVVLSIVPASSTAWTNAFIQAFVTDRPKASDWTDPALGQDIAAVWGWRTFLLKQAWCTPAHPLWTSLRTGLSAEEIKTWVLTQRYRAGVTQESNHSEGRHLLTIWVTTCPVLARDPVVRKLVFQSLHSSAAGLWQWACDNGTDAEWSSWNREVSEANQDTMIASLPPATRQEDHGDHRTMKEHRNSGELTTSARLPASTAAACWVIATMLPDEPTGADADFWKTHATPVQWTYWLKRRFSVMVDDGQSGSPLRALSWLMDNHREVFDTQIQILPNVAQILLDRSSAQTRSAEAVAHQRALITALSDAQQVALCSGDSMRIHVKASTLSGQGRVTPEFFLQHTDLLSCLRPPALAYLGVAFADVGVFLKHPLQEIRESGLALVRAFSTLTADERSAQLLESPPRAGAREDGFPPVDAPYHTHGTFFRLPLARHDPAWILRAEELAEEAKQQQDVENRLDSLRRREKENEAERKRRLIPRRGHGPR